MKKLFLTIINVLSKSGEIESANMSADYSWITLNCGKATYNITISARKNDENDNN